MYGRGGAGRGGKGVKGGKGKGRGGKGFGGRFSARGELRLETSCNVATVAPSVAFVAPTGFVGPISWSGRDSERGQQGTQFNTGGRRLRGTLRMGGDFDVLVNMCPVELQQGQRALYRVDFDPEQELPHRRRRLIRMLSESVGEQLAYDGNHQVFTTSLIGGQQELTRSVMYAPPNGGEEVVRITLKGGRYQDPELTKASVMFFCSRFKAAMAAQAEHVPINGEHYFIPHESDPELRCTLATGLHKTIYITECGPVLNVDLAYKLIRDDTVWDLIQRSLSRADIVQTLQRTVVLPFYCDPRHRALPAAPSEPRSRVCPTRNVIVDAVEFDLSPQSTFNHKGTTTTFADYFRRKYSIDDPELEKPQPMLKNVSRRRRDNDGHFLISYYIPSLCRPTGLPPNLSSSSLTQKTSVPPGQRLTSIHRQLVGLLENEAFRSALQPWGVSVMPSFLRFKARRLPTPRVSKANNAPVQVDFNSETWAIHGSFEMFDKATCFDQWAVLTFRVTEDVRAFLDSVLGVVAPELGLRMAAPQVYDTNGSREPQVYCQQLLEKVLPGSPKFILIVLPTRVEDPYICTKQLLAQRGLPSQFVVATSLQRRMLPKATNIVVEMNCKGGGAPWTVDCGMDVPTMFVGLDIHHSRDVEHKGCSVAAFVASLNCTCTRYYSRTFLVKAGQTEMEKVEPESLGLKELALAALEKFTAVNNSSPPQRIVVYRDGGSEGELGRISACEVQHFRDAIHEAEIDCTLTFFVVLKRIRTRFFMTNPTNSREVANPPPGTVVDQHITNGHLPEFFLCCQSVNRGAATPTKYQLVYDDSGLDANTLQMCTYSLSHLYFNWCGTIRVPAIVQYADRLAEHTGAVLNGVEASHLLWDKLHYL